MRALVITLLVALASGECATSVEGAPPAAASLTVQEAPANPLPLQVLVDDDPWDEDERDDTETARSKLSLGTNPPVESPTAICHPPLICSLLDARSTERYRLLNLRW